MSHALGFVVVGFVAYVLRIRRLVAWSCQGVATLSRCGSQRAQPIELCVDHCRFHKLEHVLQLCFGSQFADGTLDSRQLVGSGVPQPVVLWGPQRADIDHFRTALALGAAACWMFLSKQFHDSLERFVRPWRHTTSSTSRLTLETESVWTEKTAFLHLQTSSASALSLCKSSSLSALCLATEYSVMTRVLLESPSGVFRVGTHETTWDDPPMSPWSFRTSGSAAAVSLHSSAKWTGQEIHTGSAAWVSGTPWSMGQHGLLCND